MGGTISATAKALSLLKRFSLSFGTALSRYYATNDNCQDFFAQVIQWAQAYETKEKPLVLP